MYMKQNDPSTIKEESTSVILDVIKLVLRIAVAFTFIGHGMNAIAVKSE